MAASAVDEKRLVELPPLEQRVREAEWTLTQLRGIPFTLHPPTSTDIQHNNDHHHHHHHHHYRSGDGKHEEEEEREEEFAPMSVAESARLNSWEWLFGWSKRAKWIRYIMQDRVLKVRRRRRRRPVDKRLPWHNPEHHHFILDADQPTTIPFPPPFPSFHLGGGEGPAGSLHLLGDDHPCLLDIWCHSTGNEDGVEEDTHTIRHI